MLWRGLDERCLRTCLTSVSSALDRPWHRRSPAVVRQQACSSDSRSPTSLWRFSLSRLRFWGDKQNQGGQEGRISRAGGTWQQGTQWTASEGQLPRPSERTMAWRPPPCIPLSSSFRDRLGNNRSTLPAFPFLLLPVDHHYQHRLIHSCAIFIHTDQVRYISTIYRY